MLMCHPIPMASGLDNRHHSKEVNDYESHDGSSLSILLRVTHMCVYIACVLFYSINPTRRSRNSTLTLNLNVWHLDFGLQAFGADSREAISRIIRILGAFLLLLSSSIENKGKSKPIKFIV